MSLEDEARELDARDAAAELDAARESLEESKRQWKIQWWIEHCGMPTGLGWEEAQAWAIESQRQSDLWNAAWEGWKRRVYQEIDRRSHGRMIAAGFTREELEPTGYMPQSVEPADPRKLAFEAAFNELMEDQRALHFIFGGDSSSDVGESDDGATTLSDVPTGLATVEPPPPVRPLDVDKQFDASERGPLSHTQDFRSIRWFGTFYGFTAKQAAVVRVLWEAWEMGCPDVGAETLLRAVDHEAPPERMNTLFRTSKCWNVAIVPGSTKGSYRLKPPAAAE